MEHLHADDLEVWSLIRLEEQRQASKIRLIASENYVSHAVREATGSVLTNKYSEGYPGKRYYEGQQNVDLIEELARKRASELFGVKYVNVQPYSGSPANLAVYFALLEPGDTLMGLHLTHGGHLTHGWKVNFSGVYYNSVPYRLGEDCLLDYDEIERLAKEHKPKLIISGTSAYSRFIDWQRMADISKSVGAYSLADIAHIAGLVAAGVHPSPVGIVDVVTTTTHKSLRGPRGAMIMTNDEDISKKIDRAIIPGLQGGPHNNTTAAIAVALKEALRPEFKQYAGQVIRNAAALADALTAKGYQIISGGTENHLMLIDMTNKGISGKQAAQALDIAGLETNYNMVPDDPRKPFDPSGLRLGTAATTTRGMTESDMVQIADWIDRVVSDHENDDVLAAVREEVAELCAAFPAQGLPESDR